MKNLYIIFLFVTNTFLLLQTYDEEYYKDCTYCTIYLRLKITGKVFCRGKPSPNTWFYFYWRDSDGWLYKQKDVRANQKTGYFELSWHFCKYYNDGESVELWLWDNCNTNYWNNWVKIYIPNYLIQDIMLEERQFLDFEYLELSFWSKNRDHLDVSMGKIKNETGETFLAKHKRMYKKL